MNLYIKNLLKPIFLVFILMYSCTLDDKCMLQQSPELTFNNNYHKRKKKKVKRRRSSLVILNKSMPNLINIERNIQKLEEKLNKEKQLVINSKNEIIKQLDLAENQLAPIKKHIANLELQNLAIKSNSNSKFDLMKTICCWKHCCCSNNKISLPKVYLNISNINDELINENDYRARAERLSKSYNFLKQNHSLQPNRISVYLTNITILLNNLSFYEIQIKDMENNLEVKKNLFNQLNQQFKKTNIHLNNLSNNNNLIKDSTLKPKRNVNNDINEHTKEVLLSSIKKKKQSHSYTIIITPPPSTKAEIESDSDDNSIIPMAIISFFSMENKI